MAGPGPEKAARRATLDSLARELRRPGGPGCRRRLTWRLVPYLSIGRAGRGRLRVYCIGARGRYGFVTGDGTVIRAGQGAAAAARDVAAACGRPAGEPAARRPAGQPGP